MAARTMVKQCKFLKSPAHFSDNLDTIIYPTGYEMKTYGKGQSVKYSSDRSLNFMFVL